MPTCYDLGDRDTIVGQVHWRFAEQTPVSQYAQLVTELLRDVQPVQLLVHQSRESVVELPSVTDDSCGSIQHSLLPVCGCFQSRGEDCVAVVDARRDEGMHECRRRISVERAPDTSELTEMMKARCADTGNVFVQTQNGRQMNSQHTYNVLHVDLHQQ